MLRPYSPQAVPKVVQPVQPVHTAHSVQTKGMEARVDAWDSLASAATDAAAWDAIASAAADAAALDPIAASSAASAVAVVFSTVGTALAADLPDCRCEFTR